MSQLSIAQRDTSTFPTRQELPSITLIDVGMSGAPDNAIASLAKNFLPPRRRSAWRQNHGGIAISCTPDASRMSSRIRRFDPEFGSS
jgi:hypothetical protein